MNSVEQELVLWMKHNILVTEGENKNGAEEWAPFTNTQAQLLELL